jgi:hypothetical protein
VTDVYLEVAAKRVFAVAVEWPGWTRAGKDEQAALEALAAYAPRYAPVAQAAGIRMPQNVADTFEIVDRLQGNATTDFGAPGIIADMDRISLTPAQAKRVAVLVAASWTIFDEIVAGAPATLRKGPRGGGRDRDKMVGHVRDAEVAYARRLGVSKERAADRDAVLAALQQGGEVSEQQWPPRYAARRIAYSVRSSISHA